MHILKLSLPAAVVALAGLTGAAGAADMPPPPPPEEPCCYEPPVEKVSVGGFYLRGYIGVSSQEVDSLDNELFDGAVGLRFLDEPGFDSAPFFGGGVGYKFNEWLRGDITAEYRGKAKFAALDRYEDPWLPTGFGVNDYRASKSEWLFLANAYLDLGSWHGLTPYVGAGIGTARNTIHHFRDVNIATGGLAYGAKASKWDLAYALHAGLSYDVTPSFTVDLAYRYLNLGDAESGDLIAYTGANSVVNPMHFKDITSHDVMLGVRWGFGGGDYYEEPYYAPEPVAYEPEPEPYYPPPLYTK